jgi:type II secretory pathway component PulF
MNRFHYSALDGDGKLREGTVSANSERDAA